MKTVRELMQIEVWSPRTTKESWRISRKAGTVLLVGIMAFLAVLVVKRTINRTWLSPIGKKYVNEKTVEAKKFRTAGKEDFVVLSQRYFNEMPTRVAQPLPGLTEKDREFEMAADRLMNLGVGCREYELGLVRHDLNPDLRSPVQAACEQYRHLESRLRSAVEGKSGF